MTVIVDEHLLKKL